LGSGGGGKGGGHTGGSILAILDGQVREFKIS